MFHVKHIFSAYDYSITVMSQAEKFRKDKNVSRETLKNKYKLVIMNITEITKEVR